MPPASRKRPVQAMTAAFGTRPEDLVAAVGPCIQQCCFETDGDVPAAMRDALGADAEPHMERRGAKFHVDLAGLNRQWLLRAVLRRSISRFPASAPPAARICSGPIGKWGISGACRPPSLL